VSNESVNRVAGGDAATLRFETVIPLVTNPFLWADMLKVLGLVYVLLFGFMLWILRDEPWDEVVPAWRVVTLCVLAVLALLQFVCLVVFRNGFGARFTLDAKGVGYESGRRAARVGTWIGILFRSPSVTGASLLAETQSTMLMPWKDVRKVTAFPRRKVITLSNSWRPVLRVYCPDEETYQRALAFVNAFGPQADVQPRSFV
jgi:hypothetical protein